MAEKIPSFPDSVELNGADCFLLHLDKMMWSSSQQRNVCTFVVTLEQRLERDVLQKAIKEAIDIINGNSYEFDRHSPYICKKVLKVLNMVKKERLSLMEKNIIVLWLP